MAVKAVCNICGEPHKVRESNVGSTLVCKACEIEFRVPQGPVIPDDAPLEDDDDDEENEASDESAEDSNVWPVLGACGSVLVSVFVVGYFVKLTVDVVSGKYDSPASASTRSPGRTNRDVTPRPPHVPPPVTNRPDVGIPNTRRPAFPDSNPGGVGRAPGASDPTLPGTRPDRTRRTFPRPRPPSRIGPGRAERTAPGLTTDPAQPVLVDGFAPARGPAGTVVTIRGKGFEGATRVVFVHQLPHNAKDASFEVVSDAELQATVPGGIPSRDLLIEVHTPRGTTVTFPSVAGVVDEPTNSARARQGVLVRNGGAVQGAVSGTRVFVEDGGRINHVLNSRVYLQSGAACEKILLGNRVVAAEGAKFEPPPIARFAEIVEVPALYPSYVDKPYGVD